MGPGGSIYTENATGSGQPSHPPSDYHQELAASCLLQAKDEIITEFRSRHPRSEAEYPDPLPEKLELLATIIATKSPKTSEAEVHKLGSKVEACLDLQNLLLDKLISKGCQLNQAERKRIRSFFCDHIANEIVQLADEMESTKAVAEEQFRIMAEKSWEVVACLDHLGRITFTTKSAKQISGFEPKELVGRTGFELVHPEDRLRITALFTDLVLHLRQQTGTRFRLLTKSGGHKWVHCTGTNLLSHQAVKSIVIYYHDITKQMETEEALKAREAQFRTLADSIPQLAWMANAEGEIIWYNHRWFDYTGTTFEEMQEKTWKKFCHPDHVERVEQSFLSSLQTARPWEETFPMTSKKGGWRWFLSRAVPVTDDKGKPTMWIGTNTDVTERHEAHALIQESRERLELALSAAKMGTFDWDLRSDKHVWSPQTEALYGFKPGEYKGTFQEIMARTHPADLPQSKAVFLEALRNKTQYQLETRIILPGGGIRWIGVRGRPYFDDSGKPVRVIGVAVDLTEQKKILAELTQAKITAERASSAKSQFLANMSHEIRTPLGAILGFTELIRDPGLDKSARLEYAEIVHRNGHQLASVLNDILDLSKVEAGKLETENVVFSLVNAIRETTEFLSPTAASKGIELYAEEFPKDIPDQICSDSARVKQVLMNVLGNSIKFTPSGGKIRVAARCILQDSSQVAQIDIEDTGIGMTPEQRAGIFKAFFQGDSSMNRRYGGTGLGLVISKNLAQLLGGDLELIRSEPNRGSLFRFSFLANPPEESALSSIGRASATSKTQAATQAAGQEIKGAKILLAEDSVDNKFLIQQYLKSADVQLEMVSNGKEALDKATTDDFDLIFMDIQMPVMDGNEATKTLRARGYDKPIIALTAHALVEERNRSLSAGCNEHLTKPVDKKLMLETISKYLQKNHRH